MSLNQNLTRWIIASISKHFEDRKQSLTVFIEGQIRKTRELLDFLELRIDGPNQTELSKGFWQVYVEINVLVQSAQNAANYHRIYNSVGIAVAAFTQSISILKLGTAVGDDGSLVGCLNLQGDKEARERIQISHFGQVEPETGIFQSSVEGHYVATLRE